MSFLSAPTASLTRVSVSIRVRVPASAFAIVTVLLLLVLQEIVIVCHTPNHLKRKLFALSVIVAGVPVTKAIVAAVYIFLFRIGCTTQDFT